MEISRELVAWRGCSRLASIEIGPFGASAIRALFFGDSTESSLVPPGNQET